MTEPLTPGPLRQKAISGAKWTGGATVASASLQLLQIAVLARFLDTEQFGLMAIVMLVIGFSQSFADLGMQNAIIHRQDLSAARLSSLYFLNIAVGGALYLIIILLAPLIAWGFDQPALSDFIRVTTVIFLIHPLGGLFFFLMQKELLFKRVVTVELSSALLGTATAIGCAWAGLGVWSLVWGQLANVMSRNALAIWLGHRLWRPTRRFRWSDIQTNLSFGLYQMGERGAMFLMERMDQLVLGAMIGMQALGLYNISFNLTRQPMARINSAVIQVAFPVFSKVQDDRLKLVEGYLTIQQALSSINAPLLLGLAAVAPNLVPTVFGDQWLAAIPLIQIMSITALMQTLGNPVGTLLMAKGRADLSFQWNLVLILARIPVIVLGSWLDGALGVALALLLFQGGQTAANYMILIPRLIGPCLVPLLRTLAPAITSAILMALAVAILPGLLGESTPAVMAIYQIGGGALLYTTIMWFGFPRHSRRQIRLLINRGHSQ